MVDVLYETLRVWSKKALAGRQPSAEPSQGLPLVEREELLRLLWPRKAVWDVKQANETLKLA